jgi:hypothetical protein
MEGGGWRKGWSIDSGLSVGKGVISVNVVGGLPETVEGFESASCVSTNATVLLQSPSEVQRQ